jgi:hypothetical protein
MPQAASASSIVVTNNVFRIQTNLLEIRTWRVEHLEVRCWREFAPGWENLLRPVNPITATEDAEVPEFTLPLRNIGFGMQAEALEK